jgi:hypothetical protein
VRAGDRVCSVNPPALTTELPRGRVGGGGAAPSRPTPRPQDPGQREPRKSDDGLGDEPQGDDRKVAVRGGCAERAVPGTCSARFGNDRGANALWQGAREARRRHRQVPRRSLRRTAARRAAVQGPRAAHALVRRARRGGLPQPGLPGGGHRDGPPGQWPDAGALRRLPLPQHLDPRRRLQAAAGDVLQPRRRLHDRLWVRHGAGRHPPGPAL